MSGATSGGDGALITYNNIKMGARECAGALLGDFRHLIENLSKTLRGARGEAIDQIITVVSFWKEVLCTSMREGYLASRFRGA